MRHSIAAALTAVVALFFAASCGDDETGGSTSSGTSSTTSSSQGGGGAGATGGGSASGGMGTGGMATGGMAAGGMAAGGMAAGGTGGMATGGTGVGGAGAFELTSSAFTEGQMVPQIHECNNGGGNNSSPPLSWTPGPSGTLSYAIVMRDLDYMNGFLHWVIWDIPANVTSLPADVEHTYQPSDPAGAKQAPFSGNLVGYLGPCSPNSTNTYEWTLYAIDVATIPGLNQQSSLGEAEAEILAHDLAEATLSGES